MQIIFTKKATERLNAIADYLYQQKCSKPFVLNYLKEFKTCLNKVLTQFPEAGILVPEYGDGIRRIVCKEYSFLYQITHNQIDILTIFKENLA